MVGAADGQRVAVGRDQAGARPRRGEGIAVPLTDQGLLADITAAQAALETDGALQRIRRKWLGNPYTDQSLAVR